MSKITGNQRNQASKINRYKKISQTKSGRIALYAISLYPSLIPYLGVLLQFMDNMQKAILSEGPQAVTRYKRYKHEFLLSLDGQYPKRSRSRHLWPVLNIMTKHRHPNGVVDLECITALLSVLCFYETFRAPKSFLKKSLELFREEYLSSTPQSLTEWWGPPENRTHREDIYNIISNENIKLLLTLIKTTISPQEHSKFLSKSGTAFKLDGERDFERLIAIVGAPVEWAVMSTKPIPSFRGEHGCTTLAEYITYSQNVIGAQALISMSGKWIEPEPIDLNKYGAEIRHTTAIPDKAYKARVITVGDYFSQYTLDALNSAIFTGLKSWPSDYTHNQDDGFEVLKNLSLSTQQSLFCYDLSQATDRFPASFQYWVMRLIFGEKISDIWWNLLTQVDDCGSYYKYGQPMGLLSSWSAFSLSHHVVVWIAALRANCIKKLAANPSIFYGIVGDDIFIAHDGIAYHYKLIMEALGVQINLSKSHIVMKDGDLTITEFIKRNSWKGAEISRISPNLIIKSFDDLSSLYDLKEKLKRGHFWSESSFSSFLSIVKSVNPKLWDSINILERIPSVYLGLSEDSSQLSPEQEVILILNLLRTKIRLNLSSKFLDSRSNTRLSEFSKQIQYDVPGIKFSEQPLVEYQRHFVNNEDPLKKLFDTSLTVSYVERVLEGELPISYLEKWLEKINSFSSLPFYMTETHQRVDVFSVKTFKALFKSDVKLNELASTIVGSCQSYFHKFGIVHHDYRKHSSLVPAEDLYLELFGGIDLGVPTWDEVAYSISKMLFPVPMLITWEMVKSPFTLRELARKVETVYLNRIGFLFDHLPTDKRYPGYLDKTRNYYDLPDIWNTKEFQFAIRRAD